MITHELDARQAQYIYETAANAGIQRSLTR